MRENPLIHMDPKSLKCEYEDKNLNTKSNGSLLLQASPSKSVYSPARGFSEHKAAALQNYKNSQAQQTMPLLDLNKVLDQPPPIKMVVPIYTNLTDEGKLPTSLG